MARLRDGEIALCRDSLNDVLAAKKSPDYSDQVDRWAGLAAVKDDILSFGISVEGRIVGQIILHDWDRLERTSLVGYYLYEQETRGRGIGKRALRLLQRHVAEQTDIRHLVAITTDDNIASHRICPGQWLREGRSLTRRPGTWSGVEVAGGTTFARRIARLPEQETPMIVVQAFENGLAAIRAANPDVKLSVGRDPALADEPVLLVEYPAPTGDPAGRDVWCDAAVQDWTPGRAISFRVKPGDAMRLSVSFLDRNRVAYTSWTELQGDVWQTVRIAFDEIRPNPYFQPPGATTGAP